MVLLGANTNQEVTAPSAIQSKHLSEGVINKTFAMQETFAQVKINCFATTHILSRTRKQLEALYLIRPKNELLDILILKYFACSLSIRKTGSLWNEKESNDGGGVVC